MLLSPAILALVVCSALALAVTAAAAVAGLPAVIRWDPEDGSARQLAGERRMLLVETVLKWTLICQLGSLFLFIFTVDDLHPRFTGAMCAAGTLGASRFGYPALLLKVVVFVLCCLWLVASRATLTATATALVRGKHLLVLPLVAALGAENVLQLRYFSDLDPAILTSCCATAFGAESGGIGSDLAALPVGPNRIAFFALLAMTLVAGGSVLARRRGVVLFAALAALLGVVSVAAVITWVAPGFYQLPTHHCPFCLLHRDQAYVGYPLYALLSLGVVAGAGAGLVHGLRALDAGHVVRHGVESRLCLASMTGFALFALIASWPMLVSGLRLEVL